jgi:hypothetical protein
MVLKVIIDDQLYELNVPEAFIEQAGDFFDQMDRDMDKGWQMSREWLDHPDREDRCRIVGNKLLTALEKENHKLGRLMAGYILSRLPEVESMELDTSGEIQNTRINLHAGAARPEAQARPAMTMDQPAALDQANKDITQVFKVGRHWRFSVYDHKTKEWVDSPSVKDQAEAEKLRERALRIRYEELTRH